MGLLKKSRAQAMGVNAASNAEKVRKGPCRLVCLCPCSLMIALETPCIPPALWVSLVVHVHVSLYSRFYSTHVL